MKILHLFSDFRKTGPAQPVIDTCRALMDRGHEVVLACRATPRGKEHKTRPVTAAAEAAGINFTTHLGLNRYIGLTDTVRDVVRIPAYLRREKFDIVHSHLPHDAHLAGAVMRLAGRNRPKLIRTLHMRSVLPANAVNRFVVRNLNDGLLVFTEGFRRRYIEEFGVPEEKIGVVPPHIDTERLDPAKEYRDMRSVFGIAPDAVTIGIVGRFQAYRRTDVFFQAAKIVAEQEPAARFIVVGASRQAKVTVDQPIAELGLQQQVIKAGYRREDYVDTVAMMDIFTILMPGSDGTARAVREAMALAKPCVVSDFGMLPELAPEGQAGRVVPMDPAALAAAWLELIRDPQRRRALGASARAYAQQHFNREASVDRLEAFYRRVVGK